MSNETDLSLQDEVRAAMALEEPADKAQPRDEGGKFVAKDEPAAETTEKVVSETQPAAAAAPTEPAAAAAATSTEPLLTQDKAPQGWIPEMREKWDTIPEDVRKEILRREEDTMRGVRQLQERYTPMENFVRSMEPVFNEARASGASIENYIGGLMNTERVLRTADTPAKFQEILRVCDQYGIPLRDVVNASVGQEILTRDQAQAAVPPQIQQELQQMRAWQAKQEELAVEREITAFVQGKEFFADVQQQMATLIEGGAAANLQEAYDIACWANPSVRSVMLARQNGQQQQEGIKSRQTVAAVASVKPSGSLDVNVDSEDDDLADTVRKAFASASSGRV